MSIEREHIDEIFSDGLEDYEDTSLDINASWEAVNTQLPNGGFWSFSLKTFNVYFLGGISAAILGSVWMLISSSPNATNAVNGNRMDTLVVVDKVHGTVKKESDIKTPAAKFEKKNRNALQASVDLKLDTLHTTGQIDVQENSLTVPSVTVEENKQATDTVVSEKEKIKIKSPPVIKRIRDTIYKVDTTFTHKRRKAK